MFYLVLQIQPDSGCQGGSYRPPEVVLPIYYRKGFLSFTSGNFFHTQKVAGTNPFEIRLSIQTSLAYIFFMLIHKAPHSWMNYCLLNAHHLCVTIPLAMMGSRYSHILRLRVHRFCGMFYMRPRPQAHGFVPAYSKSGSSESKFHDSILSQNSIPGSA